jgi:pimeloyl-ACP methyl ester carboxylesterase
MRDTDHHPTHQGTRTFTTFGIIAHTSRRHAVALTLGLALVAPALTAHVASAAVVVPVPAQDPFYDTPPNIATHANGAVLAARPVRAMALAAPIPAKAWQIKYKTIDQRGRPTAFVTTLLVPETPWVGPGSRPLISYQVAVDALSTKCAPSYIMRAGLGAAVTGGATVLQSNAATETANIEQAVLRGFAVAVPDWEGPSADWVADGGAGRGVLDGIRAVKAFKSGGIGASAAVGLVGYSGGALATDWAVQKQPAYAPELRFAGVAMGGIPADIKDSIQAFKADTVGRGAIALLIASLQRSYPSWHLERDLSPVGRRAVANSQHDCLLDALIRNKNADPTSYEVRPGALFDNAALDARLARISPLNYPGNQHTPILFYHATKDQFASIEKMRQLAARYCGQGRSVHVVESPVGDHISYVLAGFPTALDYLADRFSGGPPPSDC